jgi:uncharacterized protein (DUF1810 family)
MVSRRRAPRGQPYDASCRSADRFLAAQATVYDEVLERRRGSQDRALDGCLPADHRAGYSLMSQRYSIASSTGAHLAHPVLGDRLRTCAGLV